MTVRIAQIVFAPNSRDSECQSIVRDVPGAIDILAVMPAERNRLALSLVRQIMRDRPCTKIPVVVGMCAHTPNQWGDNVRIEVEYDKDHAWRAHYAIDIRNPRKLNLYMD